jgi:hypothetical protein
LLWVKYLRGAALSQKSNVRGAVGAGHTCRPAAGASGGLQMKRRSFIVLLGTLALAGCGGGNTGDDSSDAATDITGAGSTFVYQVLAAWSADYSKSSGVRVNYQ